MSKDNPHYLLVPRKTVITIISVFVCLMVGIIASFQYANYVDRQSNQKWCGVVTLFNESYKEIPPTTDLGRKISAAMLQLEGEFKCQN